MNIYAQPTLEAALADSRYRRMLADAREARRLSRLERGQGGHDVVAQLGAAIGKYTAQKLAWVRNWEAMPGYHRLLMLGAFRLRGGE